jgi:excisionase family DNA binding protein
MSKMSKMSKSEMITRLRDEQVTREIEDEMDALFPHGVGQAPHTRVRRSLEKIAHVAFQAGKIYALVGLMTVGDVAERLGVTRRRASALIKNRHEKFGVGMKFGSSWLIHYDDLPQLEPDKKYRKKHRLK